MATTEHEDRATRLLAMQGWTGDDLVQARETGIWQRFSPGVCMVFTIIGTVLASPGLLLALAGTAVVGALTSSHPFDIAYNHGIRHLVGRPPLPPSRAARRSACAIGAPWLVATAVAFATGADVVGTVLGFSLAGAAAVVTFANFCIPSFLFTTLFGRDRACRASLPTAFGSNAEPPVPTPSESSTP